METILKAAVKFWTSKSCDFWKWKKECKDHKRISGRTADCKICIRVKNRS